MDILLTLRFRLFQASILYLINIALSCKKLIEVDPPISSTNVENVYSNDETAAAVLTGIYSKISNNTFTSGGLTSVSFLAGLSSDELTLYSAVTNSSYNLYYRNSLNVTSNSIDFWVNIYPIIFSINSAIVGLERSESLTPDIKRQLLGEAKFLRGFSYFYLLNLYGDIPLALNDNWHANSELPRTDKEKVLEQIILDLKEAEALLSEDYKKADARSVYSTSSEERVRPNKMAATALLARAYLFSNNYELAVERASLVINSSRYKLEALKDVFLKKSREAIWQLQPVINGYNTVEGRVFTLPSSGPSDPNFPVYLSSYLISSFDHDDQRKVNWTGNVTKIVAGQPIVYYYSSKYKVFAPNAAVTEYTMVLRLAEQFLIRSEALAHTGKINEGLNDLNVVRKRAGLNDTLLNDKEALLDAVLKERRVELFTEWGHRWFDLKRTQKIGDIMSTISTQKGGSWEATDQLYPVPLSELQKAPQLTQNPGY